MSDPLNLVTLSENRRTMVIVSPDGTRSVTLKSESREGFTDRQVQRGFHYEWSATSPGQRNICQRVLVFGHPVYLHLRTGKPTQWRPSMVRSDRIAGACWLRGMVAVGW